jgi:cell wall-associated NlpC family hydrolase
LLKQTSFELVKQTTYLRKAQDKDAPHYCNCVTSIRYIFQRSGKVILPKIWLGDFPRILVKMEWKVLKISPDQLQAGDVVFWKKPISKRMVTHMTLALAANQFFHCTARIEGAEVITCSGLRERYEVVDHPDELLKYHDPRAKNSQGVS